MRIVICATLLALTACGSTSHRSSELHSLSQQPLLMIANVENAFDGIDQGTEYPEFSSENSNWGPEMALNKAKRVAEVFYGAKCPEIIISPEVENQNAADLIADAASRCGYEAISANADQKFPIGVAIFTSRRVTRTSLIDTGYRPHLRVDFADGLTVIGVHFKSQRDGGGDLRLKAAQAVKNEVSKIVGRRIIVAGDFNTEDDLLTGSIVQNCSRTAPGTHVYQGNWHRLDKIYSTECGSVNRLDLPFLMRNGKPYRNERYQEGGTYIYSGKGYSDHIPLYMED